MAKKIFISRCGFNGSYASQHRLMLNEEELTNCLIAKGVEIIYPHKMTSLQQIEAFSSADLVIGCSGSAMFNSVFLSSRYHKLIDIESEPHWIFAHTNLFGSLGFKLWDN